jgi:hypothetical protein
LLEGQLKLSSKVAASSLKQRKEHIQWKIRQNSQPPSTTSLTERDDSDVKVTVKPNSFTASRNTR